jgi:Zn-dependent protease
LDIDIAQVVVHLFVVIMSVSIHEFGHAWMAFKLGDDTAAREGRLTINPLPLMQAYPTSMVILPVLGAFLGVTFAYAATPVSLHRVHRKWSMRQANFLITAAGPAMNFLMACIGVGVLAVVHRLGMSEDPNWGIPIGILAHAMIYLNLVLFFFNLLPVPPLDGFSVLFSVLPPRFDGVRHQLEQMGFMLFMIVFLVGGRLISGPLRATYAWLLQTAGLL